MGEEELKEAISENESRDEVSTLTHELSVVKAAIADKSRQLIEKSQSRSVESATAKAQAV